MKITSLSKLIINSFLCGSVLFYSCRDNDSCNVKKNTEFDVEYLKSYTNKIDEIFDKLLSYTNRLDADMISAANKYITSRYFFSRLINKIEWIDFLKNSYIEFRMSELKNCIYEFNNFIDSININNRTFICVDSLMNQSFKHNIEFVKTKLYQVKVEVMLIYLDSLINTLAL